MITMSEMGESAQSASLRPVVAAIDQQMARLASDTPADTRAVTSALLASWSQLVALLALGPAPELRACPVCKHRGMRAATRCGFCWNALPPFAGAAEERASAGSIDGG